MNVDETDQHPFLAVEVDWMRRAVEAQTPLLGVCLGAQLLAKTLGAAVRPNGVKEIGWYEIDLLAAAEADPLFGGGPSRATVFQWHGDTFDLPRGAELLATGRDCRHQAFRFGPCAWGLQFHVEMTAALIDCWLGREHNCAELAKLDYIDPAAIRQATPARLPEMDVLGRQVLSRFVELCRARA
jgi:GMP synthase-like glutamine amidotransferase